MNVDLGLDLRALLNGKVDLPVIDDIGSVDHNVDVGPKNSGVAGQYSSPFFAHKAELGGLQVIDHRTKRACKCKHSEKNLNRNRQSGRSDGNMQSTWGQLCEHA